MNEQSRLFSKTPPPPAPKVIEDLGMGENHLMRLMLKTMYVRAMESPADLAEELKLHYTVVSQLLESAKDQKLVEIRSTKGERLQSEFNYTLSGEGRNWATDAIKTSQYIGPAPITLEEYTAQVSLQHVTNEQVGPDTLRAGMSDLVVPEALLHRLGPAINSGRPMLLYGAPGNGKTSVALDIGKIFQDIIYVPYCLQVDAQIIKIFDPTIHKPVADEASGLKQLQLRADESDRRWVACRRPMIITGGELTLEMLDLRYNAHSHYYEAPLHLKANGGTFLIDDLGRQLVRPKELLNRWIVPMENGIDFLTLHTGTTFSVPFDGFVIFSTNLRPSDLMDPAFLRRIPYKVPVEAPDTEAYSRVFKLESQKAGLVATDDIITFAIERTLTEHKLPLAFYQPKFIVNQAVAECKFRAIDAQLNFELVADALENLLTKETSMVHRPNAQGDGESTTAASGIHGDNEPQVIY